MILVLLLALAPKAESKIENEKLDFCENLQCGDSSAICGIRQEGEGYRLRLFESECDLLKYGCKVESNLAYGVTSMDYCEHSFKNSTQQSSKDETEDNCTEYDCTYPTDAKEVCGIRKDGEGFIIKLFEDKCKLWKHNCENKVTFTESEIHICDVLIQDNSNTQSLDSDMNFSRAENQINKSIIVVDSSMINFNNFNESIENFFAATHVFDLPIKEVYQDVNETSRRMLVNVFGPSKVFKPWITIPKNISEDFYHQPTLSSCYHKCPKVRKKLYLGLLGLIRDNS
ncbi:Uncharacterized protein OBRU01_05941 [Operophtera brumata]|uniref:Uncharacterized protein n=1 Tax=Operophtera brumata TaxID=104452 RepID=A0A0L7LL57_OPEBR|nr:Uncharacterized protein OBRU01_05941 [Operophtera brumata]